MQVKPLKLMANWAKTLGHLQEQGRTNPSPTEVLAMHPHPMGSTMQIARFHCLANNLCSDTKLMCQNGTPVFKLNALGSFSE